MGYARPLEAIQSHCQKIIILENSEIKFIGYNSNLHQKQAKLYRINEPDLYRLIFNSKLDSAVTFQNWVFEEVLTSIRKTGMYATQDIIDRMIDDKQWGTGLLLEVKKHLDNTPKQVQKQAVRQAKNDFASFGNFMGGK